MTPPNNGDDKPLQGDSGDLAKLVYQLSQESAEHHDSMLWEATYIIWGSTALLLGFVLEAIRQEPLLCLVTALLSIFLTVMVWRITLSFVKVRNFKYNICKQIETSLGMRWKPHSDLDSHSPKGVQNKWYNATTFFFVVVWLCVAARSLCLIVK
jgi:hypothetical protein